MAEGDKYSYPSPEQRDYIGRRMGRVDGAPKSTGHAKYTYDYNPKGLLYGAFVRCPYAHARVTSIDTSEAEKMPGVKAVDIIHPVGQEVLWAGKEIVAVAAETDDQARDAMRKLAKAGLSAQMTGDGFVVSQDPAPGEPAGNHRVCKVTLERVVFHAAAGAQP